MSLQRDEGLESVCLPKRRAKTCAEMTAIVGESAPNRIAASFLVAVEMSRNASQSR